MHWQPTLADQIFAPWLPQQLGYGVPMLSWVRHLLTCGPAEEGLKLLQPKLDGVLPMGWTLAAQLTFQLGHGKAAIEMLEGQLRIDGDLPSTHLFLAVLHAHMEHRAAALKSLSHCTLLGGLSKVFKRRRPMCSPGSARPPGPRGSCTKPRAGAMERALAWRVLWG